MTNFFSVAALIFIVFAEYSFSQNEQRQDVFVQSWKIGNEQITEQKIDVTLNEQNLEFEQIVAGKFGSRYKLKIIHMPVEKRDASETGKSTESWRVELRKFITNKKNKEVLSDNLLNSQPVGDGGDFFPRDPLIGVLYPKTKSPMKVNGEPFIDGQFYYPITSKRRVKVENFFVEIQVIDFRLNAADVHKVDFLRVVVELKNN
ncbi:MAG TPA: hypothetical protein VIL74_14590 [Pyrinomonadaceae bacterium]